MNPVVIIPTYIASSRRRADARHIVANYDHQTNIREEGELDRCLKSLANAEHLGLVIILVAADSSVEEEALAKVKQTVANNPHVTAIVIGAGEVELLRERLVQLGHDEIAKKTILRGYSNIRNTGLLLAQAFGFDAVIFIDDDEIVEEQDFIDKGVYGLGKLTKAGIPILVKSGYYLNREGSYLSSWEDKWYNRFWQQGSAFNEWISQAIPGPRLSRSNHVCGGCLAIHKEAFARICFDPYITRGEDLDYMINLRMHGSDIWFDNMWVLRHLPPKTPSEGNRFRQDIYRWLYEQAKLEFSWSNIDLQKVNAGSLMPYPGPLLGAGLKHRIGITARLRSLGRPDKKAYKAAAKAAKKDAVAYAEANCTKYFEFQRRWPEAMAAINCDKVISHQILTLAQDIPRPEVSPGLTTEINLNIG